MTRRKSRTLSGTEQSLWNSVAKTVVPLPENKIPGLTDKPEPALALPARQLDRGQHSQPLPITPKLSPLRQADPQREKLVQRGRLHIDGVIDLHGMRQEESDRAAAGFISRSVAAGHRVVLVITGKGSKDGEQGRGVLRKRFLQNVELGLFGGAITSVKPAHQKHGGGGAFYVFLRAPKPRREPVTKALRSRSKPA